MTLEAMEWQKAGFDPLLGLDKHFYDRAQSLGKAAQGLETTGISDLAVRHHDR